MKLFMFYIYGSFEVRNPINDMVRYKSRYNNNNKKKVEAICVVSNKSLFSEKRTTNYVTLHKEEGKKCDKKLLCVCVMKGFK